MKLGKLVYLSVLFAICASFSVGQSDGKNPAAPASAADGRSIEDLNFRGGDAAMPPFADSNTNVNSPFHKYLLSKGLALRDISMAVYAQNTLAAPVAADSQAFVGQRPFQNVMSNPILSWDMRQLGLDHAQLNVSGVWNWASWELAGPKAFDFWTLYFYKEFAHDRVEIKTGYNSNELEFIGMQVGGATNSGVQGVYAVLPYEVGMAYFPLTAPQFNLKLRGPAHTYVKSGVQRSLDPDGGPATERRNHTGLRFDPKGDKLLAIEEVGYQRPSSANAGEIWIRANYLHNSTHYTNLANGKQEPGNHAAFALLDVQLRRPDPLMPYKGLYIGGSAMTAASQFNAFDRYFEARLYQMAPFATRPGDVISLLSTYTGHSKYLTDALVAQGKGVWRNGASVTGTYNIHLRPGNYLSLGLSYLRGPAITPRVSDPLTFTAIYSVFF